MNPFKKKTGVHAAPTNPLAYGNQVAAFMDGLTLEDKARVIAATKTNNGDIEVRMRYLQNGTQQLSIWLALRGTDKALKLVPIPADEQGGPA